MKTMISGVLAAAALLAGTANAEDVPEVQDPPGQVDVHQPADVALDERNTARDTTDTLRAGSTEVIQAGEGASERAGVRWREVQPGEEARASFAAPAPNAVEESEIGSPAADTMPGTVYSDDAWLGTDLGYGVGTEPVETPLRR
jgi:hypothetical protein